MKIRYTETVLRDSQQSLIATRMPFEVMEPALSDLDRAGYYSLECWGGATFDSCLRFLDEDPWERLRKIRKACPNAKLQMLLRGQNLLGYRHYPDDIVRAFVRKSVENAIDIIRIFDALNDMRNIRVAVDETKKCGAVASGAICYTLSPIHNVASYVETAREMADMGVDTICIKDMAGIMSPKEAYELVTELKKECGLPIVIHTHSTSNLGSMTLLEAAKAGADVIDTALSSFSGGTSQPPTEIMAYALRQYGFEDDLNDSRIKAANDHFKKYKEECLAKGLLNPVVMGTDADALKSQIPGGMLSNLVSQLTAAKKLDKLGQVLEETPRVRKDLGYPPLVTPMSQMVGAQATSNVLQGRYVSISKEVKAYCRGEYGKAPGEISDELMHKALGGEKPITGRYADTLEPAFDKAKNELGDLARSDEDVLSYCAFPQQALAFFKKREQKRSRSYSYSIRLADEGDGQ